MCVDGLGVGRTRHAQGIAWRRTHGWTQLRDGRGDNSHHRTPLGTVVEQGCTHLDQAASLPTDICPQNKEAQPLSHALTSD
jgi:hypothetical protein